MFTVMPGTGVLDISTCCDKIIQQESVTGITPLQVAEALKANATRRLDFYPKCPQCPLPELMPNSLSTRLNVCHATICR
jgi:hypothetical protein